MNGNKLKTIESTVTKLSYVEKHLQISKTNGTKYTVTFTSYHNGNQTSNTESLDAEIIREAFAAYSEKLEKGLKFIIQGDDD